MLKSIRKKLNNIKFAKYKLIKLSNKLNVKHVIFQLHSMTLVMPGASPVINYNCFPLIRFFTMSLF